MEHREEKAKIFGVMARFDTPEAVIDAAKRSVDAGYREMDGYSPFPIEPLYEAMGKKPTILPWLVLGAGFTGALFGYGLEYFTAVIDYPVNIGGRPLNSIPQFIPVTFECVILFAAMASAIGMIALNGLPRPYHPVFNVADFLNASRDKFYLCIEATDPKFELTETQNFLKGLNAEDVYVVEP